MNGYHPDSQRNCPPPPTVHHLGGCSSVGADPEAPFHPAPLARRADAGTVCMIIKSPECQLCAEFLEVLSMKNLSFSRELSNYLDK